MDRHEIIDHLGRYFGGTTIEMIAELLIDATEDLEPGQVAKLGAALEAAGKNLTAQAKLAIEPRIYGGRGDSSRTISDGVLFEWIGESETTRLDAAAVKKEFPEYANPDLYLKSIRKAHIRAKITS